MAASMAPTSPAVGDQSTAAWATDIALDVIDLATTSQVLLYTPGGNNDTPGAGTATWFTMGNVTVPTWATKCIVTYSINGVYEITTVNANVSHVIKIGSVAGAVSKRFNCPTVLNQRFTEAVTDKLTGLSTGVQSVTMSATWTAGTGAYRMDAAQSYATAQFVFQP